MRRLDVLCREALVLLHVDLGDAAPRFRYIDFLFIGISLIKALDLLLNVILRALEDVIDPGGVSCLIMYVSRSLPCLTLSPVILG